VATFHNLTAGYWSVGAAATSLLPAVLLWN